VTGPAQTYRERRPAGALAGHVGCVWIQAVDAGAAPYTHRTVPNGSAELLCAIGSMPRLVGPQTGPVEETLAPGTTVVGVRLRPGALPAVLGLPASELVDRSLDAADLWGAAAAVLGEVVATSPSPRAAAEALERHVADRVAADGRRVDAVAAAAVPRLLPWTGDDVGSLSSELFISERQLRRRFEAAVGLAPKVLQRMLRFQAFLALAQRHGRPRGELARLAAEAGFADQSHLTHESLRLAGLPPGALLLEAEEHCAPGHDHTASYGPLLRARPTG
jgi:AraC-like DNA-binding protein